MSGPDEPRTLNFLPMLPYRPAWDRQHAHLDHCEQCVTAFAREQRDLLCPTGVLVEAALTAAFARQAHLATCN